jgi:1,4-alpha-glucan branching enzyme
MNDAGSNVLQIETAPPYVVCTWDANLRQRLNFADENLLLRILDREHNLLQDYTVNHLSSRQVLLPPARYRAELARVSRPTISSRSSLEPTPQITWLQDSPASHVVVWGDLDWNRVRSEVQQFHDVNWETETQVCLAVDWVDPLTKGVTRNWIPVPERDHCTLSGRVNQVELAILRLSDNEILKSLFLAHRDTGTVLQVVASEQFEVAAAAPGLTLEREILETDTLQLRARWRVEGEETLRLVLERDGEQVFPATGHTKVPAESDWLFAGLEPGSYQAKLFRSRGKTPILSSAPFVIDAPGSRTVLIPVKEEVAYAYWRVEPSRWRELTEKHGDLLGRVRCMLRVYQEFHGDWWLKPEFSPEINLNITRDYYLRLPCDRLYRAQVVAIVDNEHEETLTDYSNPVQLGRLQAGTSPVSHKWQPQNIEHPTIRALRNPKATSEHSLGYLMLHLHAHLPFMPDPVSFRAGESWRPVGYPQEWYPEAVRETYLPLLDLFETLVDEGVDFKLSMDISPPLIAMMRSQRHASDVLEYLERLIDLAKLEVERTAREEPHYNTPARMHLRHLTRGRDLFLRYRGDLTAAFKKFQDLGYLEICTCVGTHPMLPMWTSVPSAIRGHVLAAAEYHEQVFGRRSLGVWLPECAYTPGIEKHLEEAGFRYFFSEGITVLRGDSPAEFGVNAPVYLKGAALAAFPRDPETGEQVWSGEQGYPGDGDYLEFHFRGGPFKYNRITDRKSGYKQPYNPDWADRKASSHAGHFVFCRNARFEYLRKVMWKKPLIAAPYDAELFGHHWYEGPRFLYYLLKKLHYDQNVSELITPSAYLAANPTSQDLYLSTSSWGADGHFEKWMSGNTAWMYRHVHEAARAYEALVASAPESDLPQRLLRQAGRQLMLAMSSDLPFVISNGHFVDRIKEQFFEALREFWNLHQDLRRLSLGGEADLARLRRLELETCLFPQLDPRNFSRPAAE